MELASWSFSGRSKTERLPYASERESVADGRAGRAHQDSGNPQSDVLSDLHRWMIWPALLWRKKDTGSFRRKFPGRRARRCLASNRSYGSILNSCSIWKRARQEKRGPRDRENPERSESRGPATQSSEHFRSRQVAAAEIQDEVRQLLPSLGSRSGLVFQDERE
jgi:hypothetical protein